MSEASCDVVAWSFHTQTLPACHRAAFDEWMLGTRDLASFVPSAWRCHPSLTALFNTLAWEALEAGLRDEYRATAATRTPIFPPFHLWFRPLAICEEPARVRVVLPAAAPYAERSADGLAYSVAPGSFMPDTLRNIVYVRNECVAEEARMREEDTALAEERLAKRRRVEVSGVHESADDHERTTDALKRDGVPRESMVHVHSKEPLAVHNGDDKTSSADAVVHEERALPDAALMLVQRGNLVAWATQGVLLLNVCVTARARSVKSHEALGWSAFAVACLDAVAEANPRVVCLFAGSGVRRVFDDVVAARSLMVFNTSNPCKLTWEGKPGREASSFKHSFPFTSVNEMLDMQGLPRIMW